jgi:hypothetical protein
MRLLTIILFLLAPALAQGQAFWLGARGGVLFNNAPSGIATDYFKNVKGGTGWIAGATASVEIKHWLQLGIGFDRVERNFSYGSPLRFRSEAGVYNMSYEVNSRAVSGYVFANYRHTMGRNFLYAGLQAGDFQAMSEDVRATRSTRPDSSFLAGGTGTRPGAFVGAQLGYNYHLGGSWGIQAEVAARYRPDAAMYVLTEQPTGDITPVARGTSFAYYPITLAITYRLNTARHKPIDIPKAEQPADEPDTAEDE